MFPNNLLEQARGLIADFRDRGLRFVTAESCTGGLVAGCVTEIAGASDIFFGGFVAYDNRAKVTELGVDEGLIREHGAVSPEVARAMASGAMARTGADVSVSVTGIAGPGGGTPEKPVGLVHFAAARRSGGVLDERRVFSGDRSAIRLAAVGAALELARRAATE
ncbi:MAG: CinA family protein [Alphaproteobacteria bacterium]|jgi:nicotinamide-nucleotide amidase